jgi:lipoprotein signal peptidase
MANKVYLLRVLIFTIINMLISILIQKFDLWHVRNYSQELFRFGWVSFFLILALGIWIVLNLRIYHKYPVSLIMILAGFFSNFLERFYFGYVTDYLNFGIGVANLADVEIYLACFCIIVSECFGIVKTNRS